MRSLRAPASASAEADPTIRNRQKVQCPLRETNSLSDCMSNIENFQRVTVRRIGNDLQILIPSRQTSMWAVALALTPLLLVPALLIAAIIQGVPVAALVVLSILVVLALSPIFSTIALLAWNTSRSSAMLILTPTKLTRWRKLRLFTRNFSWNRSQITDVRVRMTSLFEITSGIIGPVVDLRTSDSLAIWRLLDRRWTTLNQSEMEWIVRLLRHELRLEESLIG
jgi:hypothetical protein